MRDYRWKDRGPFTVTGMRRRSGETRRRRSSQEKDCILSYFLSLFYQSPPTLVYLRSYGVATAALLNFQIVMIYQK